MAALGTEPARQDIVLRAGDTTSLTVWLHQVAADGTRKPLVPGVTEVFQLRVGDLIATTADTGIGQLFLIQDDQGTRLYRGFSAAETAAFSRSKPSFWSLTRIPGEGFRHTYLVGFVTAFDGPNVGPGDTSLELNVSDAAMTVSFTVPDFDTAIEATRRVLEIEIDDARLFAVAAALLLG